MTARAGGQRHVDDASNLVEVEKVHNLDPHVVIATQKGSRLKVDCFVSVERICQRLRK
jgi:hypothetical protein